MPKLSYDLYNFFNSLTSSYHSKLTKVEKALENVSPAFNVIGLFDKHAVVLNENSGELYRLTYDIKPHSVLFENPVRVEITDTEGKFVAKQKDIIGNIIEALEHDDTLLVENLKERMFSLIREELKLKRILNVEITNKSIYADEKVKKFVNEKVNKVSKATKHFITEARTIKNPINTLFCDGSFNAPLGRKSLLNIQETPAQKVRKQIIEARKEAKALYNNPKFRELILRVENKKDDAEDYVEIIENYQELFTLTLKEKATLLNKIYEGKVNNQRIVSILTNLKNLASYGLNEEFAKLNKVIGNKGGEFAKCIKVYESEMNTGVYSNLDISEVYNLLETILTEGNDLLAPEIIYEFKKAQLDIKNMMESGLVDDRQLAGIVNLISQYMPQQMENSGLTTRRIGSIRTEDKRINEKIFNFDKHNQVDLFKFPLEAYKTSDVEWADGAPMMVVTSVTGKQYGFRPEEFKRFQRKTDDLTGQHQIKAWDVDSKESYMVEGKSFGIIKEGASRTR